MPSRDDKRSRRPRTHSQTAGRPVQERASARQYRCPTCLSEVDPEAVRAEDLYGRVVITRMPGKRFTRADDQRPVTDPGQVRRYLCPRNHTLAPRMFKIGLMPIALLGVSQSMKTHYLAAAVHQLADDAKLRQ